MTAGNIPTIEQLEAAGKDAGALMDATRADLERAIGAAHDRETRTRLSDALKELDRRHVEFFGDSP